MRKKNSDYTGGENAPDALLNFKAASSFGLHPVTGLLLRMQDKLMRLHSFASDGQLKVSDETVLDACEDLVNYSILCKALFVDDKKSEPTAKEEVPMGWLKSFNEGDK